MIIDLKYVMNYYSKSLETESINLGDTFFYVFNNKIFILQVDKIYAFWNKDDVYVGGNKLLDAIKFMVLS